MSPEERKLLEGLFDRMRGNANGQRDREAEQLINDSVKSQPYAPYLLAQTVLVQDQALQAANERLQQLEQQVQEHEQAAQHQPQGGGGFLSGIFGGGAPRPQPQPPGPVWNQGNAYPQGGGYPQGGYPQQGYPPPPSGPWGGGGMGGGGGGFLTGALGTAAGVAGGVLMADSIRSLFSGGHAGGGLGIAQGVPGMGGETVVNNYYGADNAQDADRLQDAAQDRNDYNQGPTAADWQQDADQDQDDAQDAGDYDDI